MPIKKILFSVILCSHLVACNSDDANAAEPAGPSDGEWQALLARVDALEAARDDQDAVIAELEATQDTQQVVIAELESALVDANATIADLAAAQEVVETALNGRIAAVEETLTCASYDETEQDFILQGCNVHVRDGSGETDTTTGLGNLIIGYDANSTGTKDKTGSHNVVIGDEHSYSSHGGLVAGFDNTVAAPWASVTGGEGNTVTQTSGSILGGRGNTAASSWSAVSGGLNNRAAGIFASISGGEDKEISGYAGWATDNVDSESGVLDISADSLNIDIATSANIEAGVQLDISSDAITRIDGSIIQLNGGGLPAARVGDIVSGNAITTGSATVLIGG